MARDCNPSSTYTIIATNFLLYSAMVLTDYCVDVYKKLPRHEKSFRKLFLEFSIWLLFTVVMFGIVYQCAPYYTTLQALPFYIIATFSSAVMFYLYLIYDEGDEVTTTCGAGEEKCALSKEEPEAMIEKLEPLNKPSL